jgi:hypothetical protein
MAEVADPRLKFAIHYAAYTVHQGDDGTWIAEPEDQNDDTQFVSRDLPELFAALDLLADLGDLQMPDIPDWAMRYLNAPDEIVYLPSAEPVRSAPIAPPAPMHVEISAQATREILLANSHSELTIEKALANNMLWTLMPSEIERRFSWTDTTVELGVREWVVSA